MPLRLNLSAAPNNSIIFLDMDSSIWLLLFSGLLLGSILVFYFSPKYVPKLDAKAAGPFNLSKNTPIIKQDDTKLFVSTDAGAFSAFVYVNPVNRTATYSSNGFSDPSATASVSNGEYGLCKCTGPNDCTNCAHAGYNDVIDIGGIVKLEITVAPDASRQQKAAAQLVLKTEGPANLGTSTYTETFILPPLEIQKWTYVTVSREGRRIDVFYNNRIVLSKACQYKLARIGASINSGSPGLEGTLIMANVYNYRLSSQNVSDMYARYSDTRGQPYFNESNSAMTLSDAGGLIPMYAATMFSSALSWMPTINLCPGGSCFSAPSIRPANPLYTWSTPYS